MEGIMGRNRAFLVFMLILGIVEAIIMLLVNGLSLLTGGPSPPYATYTAVNVCAAFDKVLGGWEALFPSASWALMGLIIGSALYFALYEAHRLHRPLLRWMALAVPCLLLVMTPLVGPYTASAGAGGAYSSQTMDARRQTREAQAFLDQWLKSINEKSLGNHMACYADTVTPYLDRPTATWREIREEKARAFALPGSVFTELRNVAITVQNAAYVEVMFDKYWTVSAEDRVVTGADRQRLLLKNVRNRWKIAAFEELPETPPPLDRTTGIGSTGTAASPAGTATVQPGR
jgi:hypothetical protein